MFTFLRNPVVALLGALAFFSCQKEVDDTPVNPGNPSTGMFKAKIDGVQYTASTSTGSILRNVITIAAYSADKKYFVIVISDTVARTYTLNQNSTHAIAFADSTDANKKNFASNQGSDSSQAGGTATITSIDKVNMIISGTFSCKLYRNDDGKRKVVTEGSFQVPYTSGLPAAKTTDTFHVQIDGMDWVAKSISGNASGGLLVVTASERNLSKIVALQLSQMITAGSYNFDAAGSNAGIYIPDGITPCSVDTGKITILENNLTSKRIRGNFSFKADEFQGNKSYQLASGYFSVGYQ